MVATEKDFAYRFLPPDEWDRLEPMYKEQGGTLPDPGVSRIFVAEREGVIIAFLVLQLLPHLQPFWMEDSVRGDVVRTKKIFDSLADMAQQHIGDRVCFIFVDDVRIERGLKSIGLERMKGELLWRASQATKSNP